MELHTLLIIFHVVGTIIGVGGATFIEIHLNEALKDGKFEAYEKIMMGYDFTMTRVGLALTITTGLGFVTLYFLNDSTGAMTGNFFAKMTIIMVIIINAVLLAKHKIGLYWGSALSLISWWTAMLIGMFTSNGVRIGAGNELLGYFMIMAVYMVAVVAGAVLLHSIRQRYKVRAKAKKT